jgi:HlyD family secretion protein
LRCCDETRNPRWRGKRFYGTDLIDMTIFFRKLSFYFAMAGIVSLVFLVRAFAQVKPMPDPAIQPVTKSTSQAIAASGLVEARNENTNIGVPISGLVTAVNVKVWDQVKQGTVLMQLDDRELKAELVSREAQVKVATASLKRLEDQLQRLRSVSKTGVVTQDDINTRENDVAVAQAQLESARAVVEQTHLLMERLTIRAPINGTILQVNTRVGEFASVSAQSPLLVMGEIELLQVRADIDEQLAPRVAEKMSAVAWVKGDPANPIELEFVRIEPYIVPKVSLTGSSAERVDTRVLQVIYTMKPGGKSKIYVGQQMDLFLNETVSTAAK